MTYQFPCPYLNQQIELDDDRYDHIITTHPGTLPDYLDQLAETLAEPDLIRKSDRDPDALLFSKWFDNIRDGRYLVVVTIHNSESDRPWIITAYTARKITGGTIQWKKS